jgi:hypothetical protein
MAEAHYRLGRFREALVLLERVLAGSGQARLSRSCPGWYPIRPLLLLAKTRAVLEPGRAPPLGSALDLFDGTPIPLGGKTLLLASCARAKPHGPVEVELYLFKPDAEDLPLQIFYGSLSTRILVDRPTGYPIVRVVTSQLVPPANVPIRLRTREGKTVDLGSVRVGVEATFGFELPSYVSWQTAGRAFGTAPVVGRSLPWRRLFGYVGERYADSFAVGGDGATGTLTSPYFMVDRDYLMLLVAGGDDPGLSVDLEVDGKVVGRAGGRRNEILEPYFLPIAAYRGRWARVVVRDRSKGSWGHIAVDEIRQLDGPAPGIPPY